MNSAVVNLQRQCDTDRRASDRRLQQLEKQVQGALGRLEGDFSRDSEWREKFSLLQGSITGLVDETQAVSRRVDGLDERLWTRTNSAEEIARQGVRDLSTQVQTFERQARLATAASEEAQKRQATRQRRLETALEEFGWRLQKTEERAVYSGGPILVDGMDAHSQAQDLRLQDLRVEMGSMGVRLQNLEAQLEAVDLVAAADDYMYDDVAGEGIDLDNVHCDGAAPQATQRDRRADERRLNAQIEELSAGLASLRVKVDGQTQRLSSLSDRMETAHVPAVEALRGDIMEARSRDLCDLQGRIHELEHKTNLSSEGVDFETIAEQMERIVQRVASGEASVSSLRRDLNGLRGSFARPDRPSTKGGHDAAEVFHPTIQDQLGAVADQLEAMDELADRVSDLCGRVAGLEAIKTPPLPAFDAMSTGSSAPGKHPTSTNSLQAAASHAAAMPSSAAPCRPTPLKSSSGSESEGLPPLRSAKLVGTTDTKPGSAASLSSAEPSPPLSTAGDGSMPLSGPGLSRKQSLESSASCEVAVERDECIDSAGHDVLGGMCDATMEVISPKAEEVSDDSFDHESFDDQDDISGDGWD
jgi:uncharacterized protein YoxC